MKKKLQKLKEEERKVDQYLSYLKEQAAVYNGRQPPSREQLMYLPNGVNNVPEHMYVKFEDITNMPAYKSETVIGIRAPAGTSLEVPIPEDDEGRFEMYLDSNGPGPDDDGARGSPRNKGEPINVYVVQPRFDKPDDSRETGNAAGFESNQESAPSPQRSSKPAAEGENDSKVGAKTDPTDQQQGSYRPHPHGHADHQMYEMHGGESGSERHPYPPHGDSGWGAAYGHGSPPGYYAYGAHRDHRYQGSEQSHMEREGEPREVPSSSDRGRREAFRPNPHHYHHHEMGRTASVGGDAPPGRPPSPSSQQNQLLTMPLQSPNQHLSHFGSPSGHGFTPPMGNRDRILTGSPEEFPILSLHNESNAREYNDGWQPPRPKISKGPQGSRR
mmetsp:Transcript_26396/g.61829  ORF Transcript_26396/g.61829 Transcript_26396/m.61829 type:complete len:386 (-) Transcript_26396:329-1486(-)